MQPDLDVGQQQEFSTRLGIAFEVRLIVLRERLAQVTLSIGRITGPQLIAETRDLVGIKLRVAQAN
jgi:hypothetical protein